ncbi:CASP-like protein 1C2 [Vitis riparia]|uniref:CASP-like protein 1C2 n=1 Tax=Vitis riparia TaxID=96939 RepID=UPI00155A6176|nr:CASP-like protein 1C2 [Vitis riparia]
MMAKNTDRICSLVLRLLAFGATLSAAIVMATSHERTTYFSVSVEAKYSHTPAFKYFVIANAIGSAYSFLLLFLPSHGSLWPLVIASDVVITMFLTSSISAALSIAYVGKKGNSYAGWLPICDQVPNYCHHVSGALAAGFIGVVLYMVLLQYSIYTKCCKSSS